MRGRVKIQNRTEHAASIVIIVLFLKVNAAIIFVRKLIVAYDFIKIFLFGRKLIKLSKLVKRVIETKKIVIDPNAARRAYCFTGTNSVIANALNPIVVVSAVKKIGTKRFTIVCFAAFIEQLPFLLKLKNSDRI